MSLGLRSSSSCGSLQQQQQHGGVSVSVEVGVSLPTVPSSVLRKNGKMLVSGTRERDQFFPRLFKFACRRKIGMLLLLIVSAVVVCSLFSIVTKDDDASSGLENSWVFSSSVRDLVNQGRAPLKGSGHPMASQKNTVVNPESLVPKFASIVRNQSQIPDSIFPPSVKLSVHPCENFSFSPPPPDRKRTGPRPCPVCYVPVEMAVALMPRQQSPSPVLKTLNFALEENLVNEKSTGGSLFGGYPSLQQRDESFNIKDSMTVHCGFVGGKKPGIGTGFDIDNADLLQMELCHGIVVASAIFGNYDVMQQPENISDFAKSTICFFMFVDEETEAELKNSTVLDDNKRAGLWRVVLVHNLPYSDARRTGKVPKLLLHRLFPNVRYSIWIDGKLKLVRDPYQILERFLWRKNVTFAISRHYRRFDVFEEAEANKAAGKYDNASIDNQIEFYQKEGLTHYSQAKLPITSDVPEGCTIIREHLPITNLFTCVWFNEVDRFTSRDQLSFSTVRDKIRTKVNWTIDMFLDCERRDFVEQIYHRDLLQQRLAALNSPPPTGYPPPAAVTRPILESVSSSSSLPTRVPPKHSKDKKSSTRRRRPR